MNLEASPSAADIKTVADAVMALAKALPVFEKTATGHHGKYMNLDEIMHKVRPVLLRNGFVLSHTTELDGAGGYWFVTQLWYGGVVVRDSRIPFVPHPDPQKLGSQITYFRRYTDCMLFAIVADKDDDGAAAMEPAEPEGADAGVPAIDELSLLGDVASMSEKGQARLRDELIAHAETHGVSMPQVGEFIKASASGKIKFAELTTGEVNSLFCEIEDWGKGS